VDLAAPAVLGRGPELLHQAIRKLVPRLDDDRPSGTDVDRVAQEVLGAVAVQEAVRALLPRDGG
jgi:histidine ammonia-lyase